MSRVRRISRAGPEFAAPPPAIHTNGHKSRPLWNTPRHREAALAAVAIQQQHQWLASGLLRFTRNDGERPGLMAAGIIGRRTRGKQFSVRANVQAAATPGRAPLPALAFRCHDAACGSVRPLPFGRPVSVEPCLARLAKRGCNLVREAPPCGRPGKPRNRFARILPRFHRSLRPK